MTRTPDSRFMSLDCVPQGKSRQESDIYAMIKTKHGESNRKGNENTGERRNFTTFSCTEAKPSSGCIVLKSKRWKEDSRQVTTSLFISMILRSNSTPQTWEAQNDNTNATRCLRKKKLFENVSMRTIARRYEAQG